MLKPRFDVHSLTTDATLVARAVSARDLFSLTSRSVIVPSGWVALASRESQDPRLVREGESCADDDVLDVLFVSTAAFECTADVSALRSADGFECRGLIKVPVRVMPDLAELVAFRRAVMGSGDSVRVAGLTRYLDAPMREVLAQLASQYPAAQLIQELDASLVNRLAEEKLGPAGFAGGLAVDAAPAVRFESPAYAEHHRQQARLERERQRQAAREQIQKALEQAQQQRLSHIVGMLERMRAASAGHDDLGLADLLRAFSETERAEFYAAQWHLCPSTRSTRFVAAVSGRDVLLFDPAAFSKPVRRVELPDDLGLLRSVSVDARSLEAGVLMVGAGWGVYLVDVETGEIRHRRAAAVAPGQVVRGGVNATGMSDHHVFATHSELGLLCWRRDLPDEEPARPLHPELTAGADTVRCAQVAELSLWFTADEILWSVSMEGGEPGQPGRYPGSAATLTTVTVAGGTVYAGNVVGQLVAWEVGEPDTARVIRGATGAPVESVGVLSIGGLDRLAVADRGSALLVSVVDDNVICRYEGQSHIIRRAAIAEDVFVAMNDNRDRLILWDPRDPRQPAATVVVPYITGHTIQDVCLIPSPA